MAAPLTSVPPARSAADAASIRLLVVDDDTQALQLIAAALEEFPLQMELTGDPLNGLQLMRQFRPHIIIVDLMMPGMTGIEFLQAAITHDPSTDVLLTTAHYSTESAVEAIQKGACDYLNKPLAIDRLQARVGSLVADWQKRLQARQLDQQLLDAYRFEGIIGRSALMLEVFARLRRVGPHFHTALVTGLTGTGKELAAHALHRLSPVAHGPFVVCNCAAIPENLVESELFGHLRGSFTGAIADKAGLFEQAHGGTLFLDEIGELPLAAQAKLLRAIQHQEVQRIGATAPRKIDVRIVAATNRNLRQAVTERQFREDLFFRLSMVEIHLPPLADRKDDLPLLLRHFVDLYSSRYGKSLEGFTRRAEALLVRYHWPGNVREMENVVGYACMMADSGRIDVNDLPERLRTAGPAAPEDGTPLVSLDEIQYLHARKVLHAVGGSKVRAAEVLGISRATLYRLLAAAKAAAANRSSGDVS